jgi:hypothetical protein
MLGQKQGMIPFFFEPGRSVPIPMHCAQKYDGHRVASARLVLLDQMSYVLIPKG